MIDKDPRQYEFGFYQEDEEKYKAFYEWREGLNWDNGDTNKEQNFQKGNGDAGESLRGSKKS